MSFLCQGVFFAGSLFLSRYSFLKSDAHKNECMCMLLLLLRSLDYFRIMGDVKFIEI